MDRIKISSLLLVLFFTYPLQTISQEREQRAPLRIALGDFKRIQNPYYQEIDLGNAISKYLGDVLFKLSRQGSEYVERGISLVGANQEYDILVEGFYDIHQGGRYVISGHLAGRREVVYQITGETSLEAFATRVVSFVLGRHGKENMVQDEIDLLISSSLTDGFTQSIDMRIGSYVALRRQVSERLFNNPEVVDEQYKSFRTIPNGYLPAQEIQLIRQEVAALIALEIIKGRVTDSMTGKPVNNATVYTDPTTENTRTNAQGRYVIDNVDTGFYQVFAEANDYISNSSNVKVPQGGEVTADIKLTLIPPDRNIPWAAVQSLVIPGLGQLYNEEWVWGVGYLVLASVPATIVGTLFLDRFLTIDGLHEYLSQFSRDDKIYWNIVSSISLVLVNISSAIHAGVSSYNHNLEREKLMSHANHPPNSRSEFVFLVLELGKDTIEFNLYHKF